MSTPHPPDSTSDPYHSFTLLVTSLLSTTHQSFTSYLRIRSLVTSPTNPELLASQSELLESLSQLTSDLNDLSAAVSAIEADPYKYGLDIEDVVKRRRWVEEKMGEVEKMKEEVEKPVVIQPNAGRGSAEQSGRFVGDDEDADGGHGDGYGDGTGTGGNGGEDTNEWFERQQQEQMMREQDVQLEGVARTVGVLRGQAEVMGLELEEQGVMLEEFGGDVERVEGKMGRGVRELEAFIRKNEDSASNWCIGFLILVLVILLFLLLVL